jgi:hypothetical protein
MSPPQTSLATPESFVRGTLALFISFITTSVLLCATPRRVRDAAEERIGPLTYLALSCVLFTTLFTFYAMFEQRYEWILPDRVGWLQTELATFSIARAVVVTIPVLIVVRLLSFLATALLSSAGESAGDSLTNAFAYGTGCFFLVAFVADIPRAYHLAITGEAIPARWGASHPQSPDTGRHIGQRRSSSR